MYKALQLQPQQLSKQTSTMAVGGLDLRDPPQFLDLNNALVVKNYLVNTNGALIKRQGQVLQTSPSTFAVTMYAKYTSRFRFYAYNDKLAVYDSTLNTNTVINTFAAARTTVNGVRYGDYFFVANGVDSLGRISRTLAYNTQTVNFTAGKKLTGQTSGVTAIILEDADGGATGTLTLGSVSGDFTVGEIIKDDSGTIGSATAGVMAWAYTVVANSPIGSVIQAIGNRIIVGNLSTDATAVWYSQVDAGTNPPFVTWTVGTLATDAGSLNYRNAGAVRTIQFLGNNIIVGGDTGKWAFFFSTIDSGGSLKKVENTVMSRIDGGISRAATITPKGMFYANKGGIWQLMSIGQNNVAFSDQEQLVSLKLGKTYFTNIDFTNAEMVYSATYNSLLISCARNSSTNNLIIVYNLEFQAFSEFTGWNHSRFINDNETIYASSSLTTALYTCFSGFADDTNEIWTEYYQEIKIGDLQQRSELMRQYVQGYLSPSTVIYVSFDIYDVNGNFVYTKAGMYWRPQSSNNLSDGYGVASWGLSSWGGDVDITGLVECFDGGSLNINNFQRLRIRFTAHDKLPHIINWFSVISRVKKDIRRRKLSLT